MIAVDSFRKVVGFVVILGLIVAIIYGVAYERISRVGNKFVDMFACPPLATCGTGPKNQCPLLASLDMPILTKGDSLMAGKCRLRICNRKSIGGEPNRDYRVEVCRSAVANPGKKEVAEQECVLLTDPRGKVKQFNLAKEGVTEYECANVWRPADLDLTRSEREVSIDLIINIKNSTGLFKVVDTEWNVRYQHPLDEA